MSTDATRPAESGGAATPGGRAEFTTTFALYAAILMLLGGAVGILTGIVSIAQSEVVVRTPQYTYALDVGTWGWIHLVLAVLLGVAGFGVLRGASWARALGITAAALNIVAHFAFLPHFPIWGLMLIALNLIVIWALVPYRAEKA
ncbi:hypothetical protein LWC35_12520 [Pseudonocardia kujensis]|uniref:DUF7144 family membrane protein n=1 Tax=Pseudonocardia kujensis TaxID=1128675 RepID=UPI001E33CA98|nr:hypothetical protein [Pseudonocardia kujensis]MCE0763725.1 hypothetical protein [Pseudonocardia kujensis]